jgi:hypothetical protein
MTNPIHLNYLPFASNKELNCLILLKRENILSIFFVRVMGQTLSEPVTAKESACCQNSQLKVGSSCMQGWRINMEDSHTHILSLPDDPGTAFCGVYDGHGGEILQPYLSVYFSKSTIYCCFYVL